MEPLSAISKLASYDAVVVGAGPNGLAAAIVLAQAGRSVLLIEGQANIGGGCRTAELTLPGYRHDVCSAIHPMTVASPFFRTLPLHEYGLTWIEPSAALAHPLDDGTAGVLETSLDATAASLGVDGPAYQSLMGPLLRDHDLLLPALLGPLRWPEHPASLVRFGLRGLRSARGLADAYFEKDRTRALFAGCAAHSILPLDRLTTAAIGTVLLLVAHAHGWPFPRGGSEVIIRALAAHFERLGGEIETSVSRSSAFLKAAPCAAAPFGGRSEARASSRIRTP